MEKDFWLERWEREEIGFHEGEVNTYLLQFWKEMKLEPAAMVFVPLCGKSLDLKWLREQGHPVLGVELSNVAVQAFFAENGYIPVHSMQGKFQHCEANGICILCGDFFDLSRKDLEAVSGVYDRASMIALPPDMRKRYVEHLVSILPAGVKILLIAIDYSQEEMAGPPFALSSDEVQKLYGKYASIKQLAQHDVLEKNSRFKSRGLTRMQESVYLLTLLEKHN
jgi:thiopurine S-methyltransferase